MTSTGRFLKRTGALVAITGVVSIGAGAGLGHAANQASGGVWDPAIAGNDGHSEYVASQVLDDAGIAALLAGIAGVALGAAAEADQKKRDEPTSPDREL